MAQSRYYSNTAVKTTLAASIGTADDQIQLASYAGMPTNYPFTLILEKDSANEELVSVLSKVGSVYNVLRAYDNTIARSHTAGTAVEHGVSAKDFDDARAHEAATSGVHGVTGNVVGDTDAQTVSNKTFTTVKSLGLDTVAPGTVGVGRMVWNDTYGTAEFQLKGGNVTLQFGQETLARVVNATASTITDGQVVYLSGAQGNLPTVALASASTEGMSSKTIGVATEPIAAGQAGYITLVGMVHGLNTSAFAEGAILWLSTTAGGLTTTRPTAPNHGVFVGVVVRSHASVGQIYVNIANGQELDELHDVLITSPVDKQFLQRDAASSVWKNVTVSPTLTLSGDVTGSATLTNLGNATLTTTVADDSHSHTSATLPNLTEDVQDIVGGMVTGNTENGISVTYDDAAGKLNFDVNDPTITIAGDVAGSATMTNLGNTTINVQIPAGTIVNADIAAGAAIAKTKLDLNGTITSADIVDGTIMNADINASAAIALSKLATDPLARANHTGTQTASTISDFDTQVRTSRLDQMAAPTADVSLNSRKLTNVADPTNAQDAVTLNYVTNQKGAANGLASLDGSGKLPQSQLPLVAVTDTFVVADQAAMLALMAQEGDVAVRTDLNRSFILTATPASTLGNWQELLTPTDSVLSVDGQTGVVSLSASYVAKSGDTMTGALTLSGDPTSNLHAATKQYVDAIAGTVADAEAAAAAAEAAYDSFDDRYLGAKASDPALDNDGNALLTGALYWNTSVPEMRVYDGSTWKQLAPQATFFRWKYTAAGGETTLSGNDDNSISLSYNPGATYVYLNGVLLVRTLDYTATNGSSITSLAALTAGDVVEVISLPALVIADAILQTVFDAKGDILVASAADTTGKLTVGSNDQVLLADSAQALGVKWGSVPQASVTNLVSDLASKAPLNVVINAQTTSYTLVAGDNGEIVEMGVGTANTLTVPTDSVNFPVGSQVTILQTGAGQTTIAGDSGVTVNATPGLKLRAQWSSATLIKRASNTWVAIGDLVA